jgi:hypothetical protein
VRCFVWLLLVGCAVDTQSGDDPGAPGKADGAAFSCAPGETIRLVLPEDKPVTTQPFLGNMTRDHLLHAVTAFARPDGVRVGDQAVELDCAAVWPAVVPRFRELARLDAPLDVFQAIKTLVGEGAHNAARNHARSATRLPASADELWTSMGVSAWPKVVIAESRVKGQTRILHCGPGISIARTHASTTGDETAAVRETEIIIEREDGSGRWDFYVYGADGALATESEFRNSGGHTTTGRAPVVCASCHYGPETRTFQNRPLTWGSIPYADRLRLPGCDTLRN